MIARFYLVIMIIVSFSFPVIGSYAVLTDQQVTSTYADPKALQLAIDNCQVSYNDLPRDIQMMISNNKYCSVSIPTPTGLDLSNVLNAFGPNNQVLVVGVFFLVMLFTLGVLVRVIHHPSKEQKYKLNENIKQSVHDGIYEGIFGKESLTDKPTSDKIKNDSMDQFKTKEAHPMGDKTHD